MSRSSTLLACLILLIAGSFTGSWYARQAQDAPSAPAEPLTTPLDAVGRALDPVFVAAMKTGTGPQRWLRLVAATEQATAADFPALIAMAEGDYPAVRLIAARWAEVDPRHMFKSIHARLLQSGPPPPGSVRTTRFALIDALFETWSRNDPAAVLKALNEVPDSSVRTELRQSAISELTKADPAIVLEAVAHWKVSAYPDPKKLQEWAVKNPAAAALAVQKLGNQDVETQALRVIGKAWGEADPQAALRHAETLAPNLRTLLGSYAVAAWAKTDPQGAAAFALSQQNLSYRSVLGETVARTMGETDPAGAVAWAESNLRGRAREQATATVVRMAALQDLARAVEVVASMAEGPTRASAGQSLFGVWFSKSDQRQAALAWLNAQPDETMRRGTIADIDPDWAEADPAGASDFLAGPNGPHASNDLVSKVAQNWATTAPETAMARAAHLPKAQASTARSSILDTWINTRPEAAVDYTTQLPAGPERNAAIVKVTEKFSEQNHERVATFIHSLQGADLQLARSVIDQFSPAHRAQIEAALEKP